jgi:hypothetical protein
MTQAFPILAVVAATVAGTACSITEQADTDTPVVIITSPSSESTVGGTVSFSAQVFDGFGIAKVEFMVDGAVIGEDLFTPFSTLWNTRASGDGNHALRVQATDHAGNTGFSSIGVTVDNSRQ